MLTNFKDFIFQSDNATFTKEEREFLDNNPIIKVYMDYSYPPYSFLALSTCFSTSGVAPKRCTTKLTKIL